MWNLPERVPPKASAFSWGLVEELRRRAYALQELGGHFDAVLFSAVGGDAMTTAVLRAALVDVCAASTADTWEPQWAPIRTALIAKSLRRSQRQVQRSVAGFVRWGYLETQRVASRVRGEGTFMQARVDSFFTSRVLPAATWRYLYECFPDAPREELDPEILRDLGMTSLVALLANTQPLRRIELEKRDAQVAESRCEHATSDVACSDLSGILP